MTHALRNRPAADVAIGYAADPSGFGIAYAAVDTGTTSSVVRIPFRVKRLTGLEGREVGYAAVAAVGMHLRSRGFGRVRLRIADAGAVAELSGSGSVPAALAMSYVAVRCMLHGFAAARLECAQPVDVADLTNRASAEAALHVAA
ncbi:MAG: hypothetical protein WCE44_08790 [Candidatus Velthaea sp.]|jgi:hypothetical protein